ncbi:MAG: spiro-SPASM protein [Spirochaetia bacterium]
MKLSVCIDATGLSKYAVAPLAEGPSAAERVGLFAASLPNVVGTTILADPETPAAAVGGAGAAARSGGGAAAPGGDPAGAATRGGAAVITRDTWDTVALLTALKEAAGGCDTLLLCRADAPFLDPDVTRRMLESHNTYVAEFTFADGYPGGMTPEILDPRILDQLRTLAEKSPERVARDALFAVVQKDINAFDVETELSPVDLRMLRATLACDTARNYLLCSRVAEELETGGAAGGGSGGGGSGGGAPAGEGRGAAGEGAGTRAAAGRAAEGRAARIAGLLQSRAEILRTLPAYTSIQVVEGDVQTPIHSPYRLMRPDGLEVREEMPLERFEALIGELATFAPDGMVHISLWGEIGLHTRLPELIRTVEDAPGLELLVETSGVGWRGEQLNGIAAMQLSSTRFIIDLDTDDEGSYTRVRGRGFQEARQTADTLIEAHGDRVYVQTIRMGETEQQVEAFYRAWKDRGVQVIVQKYDHYCGRLPDRRVTDISPLTRFPCRHTQRDLNILIDGSVPMCREDLDREHMMGNVFEDGIESVWQNGSAAHLRQVRAEYPELCRRCDEYYTFNY